jgi:site-specific DNA-methyltransferase (adenine-specific)
MWTWQDVDEYCLDTLANQFPALVRYITSVGEVHSTPMMAYLTYMAQRIIEMHRVLKSTGSLYLHCDPTASHYLKILLDEIFGKNCFKNEIVWGYRTGGVSKKWFARKHDVILFYSKTTEYLFHTQYYLSPQKYKYGYGHKHGYELLEKDGRFYKKAICRDIWDDIESLGTLGKPNDPLTGYPTQKPLALLHRIINASSNEGDIVLDPFCGCATTCVAAQQLGRKWIGIDIEKQSVKILIERLRNDAGLFKDFTATDQIPKRSDVKEEQPTKSVKERLYKEQNGKCNACGQDFELRNLEIDHIIPKSKGGGDYYENYQLLCGSCNRIKGDRPMEYLRLKIETRERMMKNKIFFGE